MQYDKPTDEGRKLTALTFHFSTSFDPSVKLATSNKAVNHLDNIENTQIGAQLNQMVYC